MASELLDWPNDAVMVVCATPSTVKREQMESCNKGHCRDCGQEICFDGYTLSRAMEQRLARGRPVKFFCLDCFPKYDFSQVDYSENHAGRKR